jgi:hypothetical protein
VADDVSKGTGKNKLLRREFLKSSGTVIGGAVASAGAVLAGTPRAPTTPTTPAATAAADVPVATCKAVGVQAVDKLTKLIINEESEESLQSNPIGL